ncbi:uncharacterized protein [Saccopteryx leptura]|uniref:uncharacterized protein isoform X1 n=2 Tax=Saccopteryx leptura TaxID=249018 RepID=UPI00339BB1DE
MRRGTEGEGHGHGPGGAPGPAPPLWRRKGALRKLPVPAHPGAGVSMAADGSPRPRRRSEAARAALSCALRRATDDRAGPRLPARAALLVARAGHIWSRMDWPLKMLYRKRCCTEMALISHQMALMSHHQDPSPDSSAGLSCPRVAAKAWDPRGCFQQWLVSTQFRDPDRRRRKLSGPAILETGMKKEEPGILLCLLTYLREESEHWYTGPSCVAWGGTPCLGNSPKS